MKQYLLAGTTGKFCNEVKELFSANNFHCFRTIKLLVCNDEIFICLLLPECADLELPVNEPQLVIFNDVICDITVSAAAGSIIRINILLDPAAFTTGKIPIVFTVTGIIIVFSKGV